MCQTFQAKFEQEASLKLVQIYFSDQQTALYKLDVLVSVGGKLIFHQALGESSFARYVRYKRTGQSQKDSVEGKPCPDECLRLPLSCECSEVTVKLIYGYTSTSLGTAGKDSSLPSTIAEFYGAVKDAGDSAAALASYSRRVEEYEKHQAAKLSALGKSVRMLSIPVPGKPNETKMVPFIVEKKAPAAAKPEPKAAAQVDEASAGQMASFLLELDEVKVECPDAKASLRQQLKDLQDKLRDVLKARARKSSARKPEGEATGEVASLLRRI